MALSELKIKRTLEDLSRELHAEYEAALRNLQFELYGFPPEARILEVRGLNPGEESTIFTEAAGSEVLPFLISIGTDFENVETFTVMVKKAQLEGVYNEQAALRILNDKYVGTPQASYFPRFIGHAVANDNEGYIVTELVPNSTALVRYVITPKEPGNITELDRDAATQRYQIVVNEIMTMFGLMHAASVMHNDTHGANFLLAVDPQSFSGFRVVAIDFGSAEISRAGIDPENDAGIEEATSLIEWLYWSDNSEIVRIMPGYLSESEMNQIDSAAEDSYFDAFDSQQ